jgi:hypothetical protein
MENYLAIQPALFNPLCPAERRAVGPGVSGRVV